MAEDKLTFIDPDNVKEIYVTGQCVAVRFGDAILLTCAAARPVTEPLFAGQPAVSQQVIVARLIFPPQMASEIARIITDQLGKAPGAAPTSGRMN